MLLVSPYLMEATAKELAHSDIWFQRCTILLSYARCYYFICVCPTHKLLRTNAQVESLHR